MQLLILGGGVFLGAAALDAALARGHRVTVFNRGRARSAWAEVAARGADPGHAARGVVPAQAVRVGEAFLLQHGVQPWSELPLWLPSTDPEYTGFNRDLTRAAAAGLRTRALRETIVAVLAEGLPAPDDKRTAGKLTPECEAQLLAAWAAAHS